MNLKTIFLFTVGIMWLSIQTHAQVEVSFAAGLNMANWPGEDDVIISNAGSLNIDELIGGGRVDVQNVENKSRFAPKFGVKLDYQLNERWTAESGLFYSPQGDRIEGNATVTVLGVERPTEYVAKSETDYLTLPLKANYALNDTFSLFFGPQVGYRFSGSTGKTEGYFPVTDETLEFEENIDDRLKDIDFGGLGGIQAEFNKGFGIYAEHYLGASQIPVEDRKLHNSVTSLQLFYRFTKAQHED